MADRTDAEMFEGTWRMVSAEEDGTNRDKDYIARSRLLVEGDRHTVTLGNATQSAGHEFHPGASPRGIDIEWDDGTMFHAIYELSDSDFRICLAPPGKPRPGEFSAPRGSGRMLHAWRRQA